MTTGEIVIALFIAFVSAGLGSLLWRRLDSLEERFERVDARFERVEAELARLREDMVLRTEFREEMGRLRTETREELGRLRTETREEIGGLRSDLTQIALAVGASKPRASEA